MANLGQALAAAVNGGLAGYRMSQDMKDRADDQAWQKEQRDAQRDQLRQQRELRAGLADAVKPVTAQAVKPLTTHDDDGNVMPAPGLWSVQNQKYGSEAEANTAAAAANTPDAQAERIGLAYMKAGMPEKALGLADAQLGAKIKRATLADSEQARKRDEMFRDVTSRFARGGWSAIPEIYKGYDDGNSATVEEDGKGGATVVQIGADGKEIGRRSFATPMDFLSGQVSSLDPKLWIGMENQRVGQAQQAAQQAQAQRNNERDYALRVQGQAAVAARAGEANRLKAEENAIKRGEKVPENSTSLRKEFEGLSEVKNYKQALPSFKGIEDAVKRNTPMSDINIVYGIAKLYDPTSVVREGEYATVANAPAMPERVKGWVQYVAGGGKLTEEVKQQILTEAKSRMGTFETEFAKSRTKYQDIAKRSNADPSLVISDDYQPAVASRAGPAGAPRVKSQAEVDALPSGSVFVTPDGKTRRKP